MYKASQIIKFTVTLLIAAFSTTAAMAHGDVPMNQDKCARHAGPNVVHFNAYQPEYDVKANYCGAIPKAGETIFVVDLVNTKLRHLPIALKIYSAGKGGEDTPIFLSEPKVYQHGVIEAPLNIEKTGGYLAQIIIKDAAAQPPVMNYMVGKMPSGSMPMSWFLQIFVIAALGIMGFMALSPFIKRFRNKG